MMSVWCEFQAVSLHCRHEWSR